MEKQTLRKVDDWFGLITKFGTELLDRHTLKGDEQNHVDSFIRLIHMLGRSETNCWISQFIEGCDNYDDITFVLQKSLRQCDMFSISVEKRVKEYDKDNHGSGRYSPDSEEYGTYKNGDKLVKLFINGHLDMLLRNSIQTEGVYNLLERVFIVQEDDIFYFTEF